MKHQSCKRLSYRIETPAIVLTVRPDPKRGMLAVLDGAGRVMWRGSRLDGVKRMIARLHGPILRCITTEEDSTQGPHP